LFFAFLLIATLLTVSVNQRLGEVAALRALGFTRTRVVADLLWESVLFVGTGGLVALPIGGLLAHRLDTILRSMPGFPDKLHFFVFEPRAVLMYAALLALTGVLAALYPVYLAARLPIAATLRKEVVS
jgi:putative ABC transport system permease protein